MSHIFSEPSACSKFSLIVSTRTEWVSLEDVLLEPDDVNWRIWAGKNLHSGTCTAQSGDPKCTGAQVTYHSGGTVGPPLLKTEREKRGNKHTHTHTLYKWLTGWGNSGRPVRRPCDTYHVWQGHPVLGNYQGDVEGGFDGWLVPAGERSAGVCGLRRGQRGGG